MKQLKLINRINELFSRFVAQVKGASAVNLYDINIISEYMLIPLFKELFNYSHLRNVNADNVNYPGIDLADDRNRVAFQISSTPTSSKINHTFSQFFRHNLDEKYDRLFFYILTERQRSYTVRNGDLENSDFNFSVSEDILDYRILMKKIQGLDIDKIEKVQSILEKQFSIEQKLTYKPTSDTSDQPNKSWDLKTTKPETLFSNLLEITFPDELYIASLDINRKEVIKASRVDGGSFLKNNAPPRQIVREALSQKGLRFANDWTCHENKIITFHDLNNSFIPLRGIIDEGTVETFGAEEFYLIDRDYENVFKTLLHFCLQRMLYQREVEWKHKDRLFVFVPEDGELQKREISWHGKVSTKRTVFDIFINQKTEKISYCKHFAFRTRYRLYENRWFVEIIPDWYITMNGFKKSYFGSEKIKWLKGKERNQQVFNHLKFIMHFLKQKEEPDLFDQQKPYNPGFLTFKDLVKLTGHILIDDSDWNRDESEEEQKRMKDPQGALPLYFRETI